MVIKMSFWSIFSSFLSFWSDFHVLIKFTHLSQSDRSAWLSNHHFCRFFVFLSFLSDFHHFGKNHENVIIFHSEVYAHSTLFAGLSQMSHFSHFCHFGENSSKNSHFWHFDLVQIAPLLKGFSQVENRVLEVICPVTDTGDVHDFGSFRKYHSCKK